MICSSGVRIRGLSVYTQKEMGKKGLSNRTGSHLSQQLMPSKMWSGTLAWSVQVSCFPCAQISLGFCQYSSTLWIFMVSGGCTELQLLCSVFSLVCSKQYYVHNFLSVNLFLLCCSNVTVQKATGWRKATFGTFNLHTGDLSTTRYIVL